MKEQVERALDKIRPALASHQGGVELVDINEETGTVYVAFQGMCMGCPLSAFTLKMGIEQAIKSEVSGVASVEAVSKDGKKCVCCSDGACQSGRISNS